MFFFILNLLSLFPESRDHKMVVRAIAIIPWSKSSIVHRSEFGRNCDAFA